MDPALLGIGFLALVAWLNRGQGAGGGFTATQAAYTETLGTTLVGAPSDALTEVLASTAAAPTPSGTGGCS